MSFDAPEVNARFATTEGFGFPLLSDPTREMSVAYGAADALDAQFARRVGVIVDPDGRVAYWAPSVSPASFPTEALARIPKAWQPVAH